MKDEVEKKLIEICLKVARQKKGCLFVIKEGELNYEHLIKKDFEEFSIFEHQRRTELLAVVSDGAMIVDLNGNVIDYAVKISNTKVFPGFGTRHSAAYSASLTGNTSVLASEEDAKVRIFKEGKLIMQIDSAEKNVEQKTSEAVNILESLGGGTLGTLATTALVPSMGLQIIPGIIVFGSIYYLIKRFGNGK